MFRNARIYLALLVTSGLAIFAGSFFPTLTGDDDLKNDFVDPVIYREAFGQELAFCRQNTDDLNCQCFASIAGTVIASEQARIPDGFYPDRRDLARMQAEESC